MHPRWTTCCILLGLTLGPLLASAPLRAAEWPTGVIPVGQNGKPLNLDLETGDLSDWTASDGDAFAGQPIQGDTVSPRREGMRSGHRDDYWIGTYERSGDQPQGVLSSAPFAITHPFASFLIAGGSTNATRVELINAKTGEVLFRASGVDDETLQPVVVDLGKHQGVVAQLRLVDQSSGSWGHINFDEFRFHAARPQFPVAELRVQAHGLPAEEAAAAMTLPPGFKATLFAAEPDVVQPIAMTIDDRGRLWVAEGLSYPQKRPADQANDRILIFEDTDGDGQFDARKVFLDKLNLVSGLEVGFGGVWIGQAPEFLFVPDQNGDDVPDGAAQVLLDGWGYHDTHETLNSFIWGPDGWLYGCHGVFTHSRVGKPGTPDEQRIPINAGIWRYHPLRHQFEVFAQGTSNPWGVDFNDQGQCFLTCCVIPHLFHVIDGARYHRQAGQHFNPHTYDDIKTIAKHRHWTGNQWNQADRAGSNAIGGGHAHAGAMVYLGGRWPAKYRNQLFMNNIHGDRLNQDQLTAHGSGYVGDHASDFLLANDAASQMLYLRYGPDGNVYVIDWYDTNECHRNDIEIHDRSNGRIFKIDYVGTDSKPAAGYLLHPGDNLQDLAGNELVELLLHENDWYVRHARRILQERGNDPGTVASITKILLENPNETRRLRALWALHVIEGLNPELLSKALRDESPNVRAWAIQVACEQNTLGATVRDQLAPLAKSDPSPVVRLALASACQRLPFEYRRPILVELLKHAEDASDHNLPLMYWYATEPLAAADMAGTLDLVHDSAIPLVRAYTLRRIAEIGSNDAITFLVQALAKTPLPERQQEFLAAINTALQGRRQVPMPAPWPQAHAKLAQSENPSVVTLARTLAVTFGDPQATRQTRDLLASSETNPEERSAALAILLRIRDSELPAILHNLVGDPAMASPAIRGLAAFDAHDTPTVLLKAYEKLAPAAKRDALATLAARPAYATQLLEAIGNGTVPRTDLTAELIRQLRNLQNADLTKRLNEVWGVVRDSPEEKQKLIEKYGKLIGQAGPLADIHLGRAVYDKTCAQCHKLFDVGGEIGPELTGSNRADHAYLLSNVLDPSAVMAKDYQPDVIVTEDGRVVTGIVKSETDDALTLATANETVIVPKQEIAERVQSETSMMPDNLWQTLSNDEIRSLVAYLASPKQVAPRLTPENAATLFNGRDLTGWKGDKSLWSVENGEIVGKSPGIKHNSFLVHDLIVGDFELSFDVKLTPNGENSGVQFRSQSLETGEMKGYQADIGVDWWGKLYEESARGLLWDKPALHHVRQNDWNAYRIRAVGDHIQTWVNDQLCVDLHDPPGDKAGQIGLQIHSGGPLEVRFRNLKLTPLPRPNEAK